MKIENFSSSNGQNFYKYLLVARPCTEISVKLTAEKEFFSNEYKGDAGLDADSNIVVARFLAKECMEETIIRWMQRICSRHSSFPVRLNNYGGLPPDTIYIRVQDPLPFQSMAEELKVISGYISSCHCPSMQIISRPNITIASKISQDIFFTALTQYARKSFHEVFTVNEFILMKKDQVSQSYKPINIFSLLPLASEVQN